MKCEWEYDKGMSRIFNKPHIRCRVCKRHSSIHWYLNTEDGREALNEPCPASPKPMPDVPRIIPGWSAQDTMEELLACMRDAQQRIKKLEKLEASNE